MANKKKLNDAKKSKIQKNCSLDKVNDKLYKEAYKNITLRVRITFIGEDKFFGKGAAELLKLVDEYGTIQKACDIMDMSYSKALKIIKRIEKELKFKIIEATAGGAKGGSAYITKEAKALIRDFIKLENDVKVYTDKLYKKYFLRSSKKV